LYSAGYPQNACTADTAGRRKAFRRPEVVVPESMVLTEQVLLFASSCRLPP
jgi:hypothetical protein